MTNNFSSSLATALAVGILALPAAASANVIAQSPATLDHGLDALEITRDTVSGDDYNKAVQRYGDKAFKRWHRKNVLLESEFAFFSADAQNGEFGNGSQKVTTESSIGGVSFSFSTSDNERWGFGLAVSNTVGDREADGASVDADVIQPFASYQVDREEGRYRANVAYSQVTSTLDSPNLNGSADIDSRTLDINTQYSFIAGNNGWLVEPSVSADYRYIDNGDFVISGKSKLHRLDAGAGIRVAHPFIIERMANSLLTPYAGVEYNLPIYEPDYDFQGISGDQTDPDREDFLLQAGADWQFTPEASASLNIQKGTSEQVQLGFEWRM